MVKFDGAGQHVSTVNRYGQTTRFSYSSSVPFRLDSVNVPALTTVLYHFDFTSVANQIQISAPGAGTSPRTTTMSLSSGMTQRITDPDGKWIDYSYGSVARQMWVRTDKRLTQTAMWYNAINTPSSIEQDAAGATPYVMTFGAIAERQGIYVPGTGSWAENTYEHYTSIELPVGYTAAHVDRFGAPISLQTSDVVTTSAIEHADARFPGLVTAVAAPNGFVTRATYDARGRLQASTAVNPHGDGLDAIISYTWDDKWDLPTSIVKPEGDRVDFSYDSTYGTPLWQQDNRGDSTRTNFTFSTGSSTRNLLTAVQLPGQTCGTHVGCDQYEYDGAGNLSKHYTALGYRDSLTNDAIGRTYSTTQQVDSGSMTRLALATTAYDVMDRVTSSSSGGNDSQTLNVTKYLDAEGADTLVSRSSSQDIAGIGTISTRFVRDPLGRVVKEVAPDGAADSTVYDTMGHVSRTINRNGDTTTFAYDAMGRMIRRATQALHFSAENIGMARDATMRTKVAAATGDSLMYASYPYGLTAGFDVAAVVDTMIYNPTDLTLAGANNGNAHVSRTYYPNGQLQTEVDSVGNWDNSTFAAHIYTQRINYDRDGRRGSLVYPTQIAPAGHDTVSYSYYPDGFLQSVTDLQGHSTVYTQDGRSQLVRRDYRSGYLQALSYDNDGVLATDGVANDSGGRLQTLLHDARGKVLRVQDGHYSPAAVDSSHYTPMGQLALEFTSIGGFLTLPIYTTDAFGNVTHRHSVEGTLYNEPGTGTASATDEYSYFHPGTGRVWYSMQSAGSGVASSDTVLTSPHASMINHYDAAGNLIWAGRATIASGSHLTDPQNERRMYYATDGKLVAVDARQESGFSSGDGFSRSFEQYRYDALGRRIVVRMQQTCAGMYYSAGLFRVDCMVSGIRRTIWDGTRELGEIQMPESDLESDTHLGQGSVATAVNLAPYFGAVGYTYDGQVDQPVAVTRTLYSNLTSLGGSVAGVPDFTFNPVWNIRGQADQIIRPASTTECVGAPGAFYTSGCITYVWQGQWLPYARIVQSSRAWQGSLLEEKQGAGGLMYRRNRYYDSNTGRFTQEDPLGLAGGMNLYGFAAGDPVNFSDPFGLCTIKDWTDCKVLSFIGGAGWGIGAKGTLGPVSAEGEVGKLGVEGSLSMGADGIHAHGDATAAAFSGSVRAGSRAVDLTAGSCSTEGGCTLGAIKVRNIEGASNGDITVKVHVGIEVGVTIHAGEAATAAIGAAQFAWEMLSKEARKSIPKDP